jgi:hypothetical protein
MTLFVPWETGWNGSIANARMYKGDYAMSNFLKFRASWPLGLVLAFVFVSMNWTVVFLSGCTPADISDAKPVDSVSTGTASLSITNQIIQDPSTLTFYLYPGTSVDWVNAANAKKIDSVQADSTRVFRVPEGSWKIVYFNRSKAIYPMIDANSGSQEWLRSDFKKNGNYSLILKTDGNRTLWVPSYVTVPAMVP